MVIMQLKVHHMKKIIVFALPFFVSMHCYQLHASADVQKVDHSRNLVCKMGNLNLDLDQCSRLGTILIMANIYNYFNFDDISCDYQDSYAYLTYAFAALIGKFTANIIMAIKEFGRNENARGFEHLGLYPFASWFILLAKNQPSDRKILHRICTATPLLFLYPATETFYFFRDCCFGKFPINWAKY